MQQQIAKVLVINLFHIIYKLLSQHIADFQN
jgi:hypothetical protein